MKDKLQSIHMSKPNSSRKEERVVDKNVEVGKEEKEVENNNRSLNKRLSINSENFVMCRLGAFDDHYTVSSKLGEGTFGTVYKVQHKTLHLERALKMIKKRGNNHFSSFQEIEVLKKLDHSNILKIYEFYEGPQFYYIITEIFQGKELFDLILEQNKLTESQAAHILKEILRALNYTHSQKIAHRDLKPENILVKQTGGKYKIKIIDWGLGTLMGDSKSSRICGTPEYVAPQVLKGNYSIACDMWSVGAIAFVMLTGEMPFTGKDTQDTIQVVKKGILKTNTATFKALSLQAQQFIVALMSKNESKRMTASQALEHPWLVKNNEEDVSPKFLKETLERLRSFKVESKFGTAVISYINNHMSEEEDRQKLEEIFKFLDKNSDGVLSLSELVEGYSQIYGKQMGKQIAEETFSKLDINHNGTLEFSEFVTFGLQQKKQQQECNLKEAFLLFDRDHNGKISKEQIQLILKGKMEPEMEAQVKEIMAEIDRNGDEQIDIQQFMKCMSGVNEDIKKKEKGRKVKEFQKSSNNLLSPVSKTKQLGQEEGVNRKLRSAVKEKNDQ